MSRAFWTAFAIAGAVLVETALGYLVASPGRYLDPFLLVVVYCALVGGETHGMLAGAAAGCGFCPRILRRSAFQV